MIHVGTFLPVDPKSSSDLPGVVSYQEQYGQLDHDSWVSLCLTYTHSVNEFNTSTQTLPRPSF